MRNWLEYLPFIIVAKIVRALPRNTALALGRRLGTLGRWLQCRRVEIARENLRHAFPEMPAPEREAIIRQMFTYLGTGFVEMLRLDLKKKPPTSRAISLSAGKNISSRPCLQAVAAFS